MVIKMKPGEKILATLQEQKELEKQMTLGFAEKAKRPYRVEWEGRGVILHLEVEDFDRYSVLLKGLWLESKAEGPEKLKEQAARLSSEVNGLGVSFGMVESDEGSLDAVLRTSVLQDPSPRFFEITLDGGREVVLRHYTVSNASRKRTESPGNMSIESFQRLVDHMVDVFGEEA